MSSKFDPVKIIKRFLLFVVNFGYALQRMLLHGCFRPVVNDGATKQRLLRANMRPKARFSGLCADILSAYSPMIYYGVGQARYLAAILLTLLLGVTYQNAMAQTAVSPIIQNEAIVNYPNDVIFRLEIDPAVTIVDAVLTYDVERFSCLDVSTQVPVNEVSGSIIEWEWVMIRSGNPPPGAEMWWEWTITDDQGNQFTTPRQTLEFADDRFEWRTVSSDEITMHWYAGDDVGPILLEAAVAGLDLLEADMGIQLQEDVEFYIYSNSSDMRDAVLYIQDWAGGVAFSEYNVILMGVPPNIADTWGRSTIRHELTHLVSGQFGRSCVGGRRPTWLEEGLAMYAEGAPSDETLADLENGMSNNAFEPLRSLNGAFPSHDDAAGAAYSQSYSVVDFLRAEYGREKMQELLLILADGTGYDAALEQIYGFNVDGLEAAWRTFVGIPQRPFPPTPTAITAANIPTAAPLAAPGDVPTPPAAAQPPSETETTSPRTGVCGLGLMPLLLITILTKKKGRKTDPY